MLPSKHLSNFYTVQCSSCQAENDSLHFAAELDIVSKSAPAAATGQALSVKIEPGTGLQEHGSLTRAQSVATPRHAKENIVPIKTPATKVAKFTPGPTPPSTG